MSAMGDLFSFVLIAQTSILVIASLLIVYPVVAYGQNVAHTRGLLLLAGAFLVITASYVGAYVLHASLVSSVLDFVASLLGARGVWQFAQPFVRFDAGDVGATTVDDPTGGFESAGSD